MSSESKSHTTANKATDGNKDGHHFAQTEAWAQQWWRVDLEAIYYICGVGMWNRNTKCKNQLL